ncbi:hypothetical protein LOD99_11800 [Oopsacas minuta]|uniref:Uncharacterized protein n=1 Tax=Oopsacas minuta TaxID=111878 RepID=A0AAV7JLX0_9METZ|nr:hypothetical protein LOD99_11800 [Oopsacas minuta]
MRVANNFENQFISYLYYSSQLLCGLHTLLLIYWLFHVLYNLITFYHRKSRIDSIDEQKIFTYREYLIRYFLFVAFLICEFGYFFDYNVYGIFKMVWNYNESMPIEINDNCSLDGSTYLAHVYSTNIGQIFLVFLRTQSTTLLMMMVWFYAVSLLHLTHVCQGRLQPNILKRWVLVGLLIGIIVFTLRILPWTSLIGVFIQSAIGQMNILLAWYMSRKFKIAMGSRVNEAYHTRNKHMSDEQEKLYRDYNIVIPIIFIALQLYYLSSSVFFNLYLVLETLTFNSCWFHATFGISLEFKPDVQISRLIGDINFGIILTARLINIVAYCLLLVLNIWVVKKSITNSAKKVKYRYRMFSSMSDEKESFLS